MNFINNQIPTILNQIEETIIGGKAGFLRSKITVIVDYKGFNKFCKVYKI